MLAKANGGSASNIAPGFAALKKLKDSGNWTLSPQAPAEGDAVMARERRGSSTPRARTPTPSPRRARRSCSSRPRRPAVSARSLTSPRSLTPATAGLAEADQLLARPGSPGEPGRGVRRPGELRRHKLSASVAKGVPYGEQVLKSPVQLDQQKIAENKAQWVQEWHRSWASGRRLNMVGLVGGAGCRPPAGQVAYQGIG